MHTNGLSLSEYSHSNLQFSTERAQDDVLGACKAPGVTGILKTKEAGGA